MKKLFLTLVVSLALCGSVLAQSHWPEFNPNNNPYEMQGGLVAAVIINGEPITTDYEGWDALEIAAFVGDAIRANGIYLNNEFVLEFGDPYPVTWGDAVFYTNPGEELTFKMYDHSRGVEYTFVTALQYGNPLTLYTGEEHYEGWDAAEDVISLSFIGEEPVQETFTKPITGYGTGNNYWYLIASPIGDVAPGDVQGLIQEVTDDTDYDLYWFNQTENDEWRNHKVEEEAITSLEAGHGYLYASKQAVTLTFTGTAYAGDGQFDLLFDGDADLPGFNLVGNPFADTATVDHAFYTLDPEDSVFVSNVAGSKIAAMEGCFVEATAEGESVTFSVNSGKKSANLALNLTRGRAIVDRAIVSFGGNTLSKFQFNPNSTKLYIPQDGKDYAVVSAGEMGEMPVNFKAEENGSFTMSFNAEGVSFNYLHLIDNLTGADVDLLATPSYSFDALTTDYASRFRLVFATGNAEGENFGFFSDGNFIISNEGEATVQVVDVTGRILRNETINGSASISLSGAAGVYMIRLINGENVRVQKVVVR